MDPKIIVMIALVIIMGWFAVGLLYNLRRGNAVLHWLQTGLPIIGEKTTFRWLGSSVAEMEIKNPKRPFRHVNLMIVLTPRDVPWFWVLASLRGRRDLLIFRSQLASTPSFDMELADPKSWTGKTALNEASQRGWIEESYQNYRLSAPESSIEKARQALPTFLSAISQASETPVRLALRCERQQMEIHLPLPHTQQDARAYFQALQAFARATFEKPE